MKAQDGQHAGHRDEQGRDINSGPIRDAEVQGPDGAILNHGKQHVNGKPH